MMSQREIKTSGLEVKEPASKRTDPDDFLIVPKLTSMSAQQHLKIRQTKPRARKTKARKHAAGVVPALPPMLECSPVYHCVLRFQTQTLITATNLTASQMAGAIGAVRSAANTVSPISSAYRIKKVIVWPPGTGVGTSGMCTWSWNTTNSGFDRDSLIVETMPGGVTTTRALVSAPPKNSLSSDWQDSGQTGTIANYILAQGAVVDIHIDYCLSTSTAQFANITTTNAGSSGLLYYLPLNGTVGTLLPVGRPTLV